MQLITKVIPPQFVKVAAKFSLSDNPATYASELTAQLYKQHPYLGRYDVNLSIEGQDSSMGYLYGVFTVSPVSAPPPEEMQKRMDMISRGGEQPPASEETLRIPIIVDNKKAHSFDVFITHDGSFRPLSEERIASALFSSSPYMVAPKSALTGAQQFSAGGNFQPDAPTSAAGAGGGFGPPNSSVEKVSSVLARIGNTVSEDVANKVIEKIAVDQWLKSAFQTNPAFHQAVSKISYFKKEAESVVVDEDFSAAVLRKAPGGYEVTSVSADTFKVKVAFIANSHAETIPLSVRQEVVGSGYCLLSSNEAALERVGATDNLEKIASTGVYAVLPKAGAAERAIVLRDVVTFEGRNTKLAYIVGKSGASIQDDVAGIRCGDVDFSLIEGSKPRGEGTFLFPKLGQTSEPVFITQTVTEKGGDVSYLATKTLGPPCIVKKASVLKPVKVSEREYLIPEDSKFIPLSYGDGFRSDVGSIDKLASQNTLMNKVAVVSDGTQFEFCGRPVDNLKLGAVDYKTGLLVLGALGDSSSGAKEKLAEALSGDKVEVIAGKVLTPKSEVSVGDPEVTKVVSLLKADLTKEASMLAGPDTVDSVLSLNFITPENVQGYIDSLPEFEQATAKLAELLIGVRLGLSDIPEPAVSAALRGLERAILGLKKLQMRLSFAGG